MDATKSRELFARGQSIWYDNISRALLNDGTIPALIRSGAIYGITTNPTIFSKAIPEDAYDASIRALAKRSFAARQILDSLMVEDVQMAADLFRELYEATSYVDGYVSLEVSPELARDTDGTIKDVKRLAAFVDRPNVLYKVPGTKEGVEAIRVLTSLGYSINVTLLFDAIQYEAVANAYLKGLAEFVKNGGDARRVNSVASVFVSRIDTTVDQMLGKIAGEDAKALLGRAGISAMKEVYSRFRAAFASSEFGELKAKGGRIQRVLWASTGTKNPAYSATIYVDNLVAQDTVNTVPPATLSELLKGCSTAIAFGDRPDFSELDQLRALGVDIRAVCSDLQVKGVDSFMKSFDEVLAVIERKLVTMRA